MNTRKILLFVGIVCIAITSYAQSNRDTFKIDEIEVERNNGSATTRNLLKKTDDNFVWYTTYNGLVKYYGSSSTLFPIEAPESGSIGTYYKLLEDSRGILWIGTRQGAYRLDPETGIGKWMQWRFPDTNQLAYVVDIAESPEGDILFSTNRNYVLEYQVNEKNILSYKVPVEYYDINRRDEEASLYYIEIEEILDDKSIILSQFNKFYKYAEGKITLLKDFSDQQSISLVKHGISTVKNGVLFDKNTSGTYSFRGKEFRYEYIPEIDRQLVQWPTRKFQWAMRNTFAIVAGVDPDSSKDLIFCGFSRDKKRLLVDDRVASFDGNIEDFIAVNGTSFIVSTIGGIYKMQFLTSKFRRYLTDLNDNNAARISVRGFAENSTGEVFVGTYNGLYRLEDNESVTPFPLKQNFYTDTNFDLYRSMLFKNDSTLLNAGETRVVNKIKLYDKTYSDIEVQEDRDLTGLVLQTITPWKSKECLIGTTQGLFSLDTENDVLTDQNALNNDINLSETVIKDILVDEETIWIATDGKGVYSKNFETNHVRHISVNDKVSGLKTNSIFVIHKGLDGRIYLGTNKGLAVMNTETFKIDTFGTYDGLSNAIIVGILEDENTIWLSTYNGLVCYNKKDDWFYNFFTKDGLPDNEFNQEAFFKSSKGIFYFGGLNGVVSFDPNTIRFTKPSATIKVTEATFFDEKRDTIVSVTNNLKERLKAVELPYSKNVISLRYAMSELFLSEDHLYEYKLVGLSDQWVSLGNDTDLRLNAIPAGNYTLQIRGDDASGNPTQNEISIPIKVKQIFYKTPWFIGLNILIIAGLFIGYYQFRKYRWTEKYNQQRKVDQLESKALRAQMNPHFMFNALNGLQSTMILKGEREANKYLGSFSKLLRSSLDMSNSDTISLNEEITYLEAYLSLEKVRQARDLDLSIKIIPEDMETDNIYIPCMLFQPIIENAIIHGLAPKRDGKSSIEICFSEDNGQLVGTVTDNGIGREAAAKLKNKNRKNHKSWATHIMKERIDIINRYTNQNIDFAIEDLYRNGKAAGTKVILRMPMQYAGFK